MKIAIVGSHTFEDYNAMCSFIEKKLADMDHPYITQLFPARRKVPYLLRKKLERGLEIALQENETYQH